jgi:Protein of unknown function (DUF2793)
MTDTTDRLSLPLLATGQAQKEATHNEALTIADMLVQPVIQSIAPANPPTNPTLGQCWIVGTGASGVWAGQDGAIAGWTAGGWRFATPFPGMTAWNLATGLSVRRAASSWIEGESNATVYKVNNIQVLTARQPAITSPVGGSVADSEGRLAISAILATLRTHGLIAP